MQTSKNLLFLTWHEERCGVHQYGKLVAEALGAYHQSISSLEDAKAAASEKKPDVLIWNWHPSTLGRIIDPRWGRIFREPSVCLMHEFDRGFINGDFFDVFAMPDPSNRFKHSRFLTCGRLLSDYKNIQPKPTMPTIGTFGFAVGIKGYKALLSQVASNYEEAIIRIHIPPNWLVDPEGLHARRIVQELTEQAPDGIVIDASHEWLDNHQLLDWLGKSSVNVFPYTPEPHNGISSSTDWALSARRPLAITNSGLFKHLLHLPICLESYSLKEIESQGTSPTEHLLHDWNRENFIVRWSQILAAATSYASRYSTSVVSVARNTNEPEITAEFIRANWQWKAEYINILRYNFPGAENIKMNYSQAWQDMFVLTMLKGKHCGNFLEIGANDPVKYSNTYLLKEVFNWAGVSIEFDAEHFTNWAKLRPADTLLIADALEIDYSAALPVWFGESCSRVDYLQLDIEPSMNTLQVLKKMPLDKYRFSVITFETDAYTGDLRARDQSREILESFGYLLVAPDVGVLYEPISSELISFEDWWVDPTVIDADLINRFKSLSSKPTVPQRLLFM